MKKQIILMLSIFALCINACMEVNPSLERNHELTTSLSISYFAPNSAVSGTVIQLFGENFGTSPSENFISFDKWGSEVHSGRIAVVENVYHTGMLSVNVPMNLPAGTYTVSLTVKGKTHSCPNPFKIIGD